MLIRQVTICHQAAKLPKVSEKHVRARLDPEERKRLILDAAADLFIERGFEAVDMADVAARAGVARPTVYKYFPSTEAMLHPLLDAAMKQAWTRLRPILAARGEGEPADVKAIFAALLEEPRILRLLHAGGGPIFQRHRRAFLSGRMARKLRAQMGTERRPYLLLIESVLLESLAHWAVSDPGIDVDALAETLAGFVARGAAGEGEARRR
jgi:AcrR family transcriptional regulator